MYVSAVCAGRPYRNGNLYRLWHVARCAIDPFTYRDAMVGCQCTVCALQMQETAYLFRCLHRTACACVPIRVCAAVTTCFTTFMRFVLFTSWVVRQAQAFIYYIVILLPQCCASYRLFHSRLLCNYKEWVRVAAAIAVSTTLYFVRVSHVPYSKAFMNERPVQAHTLSAVFILSTSPKVVICVWAFGFGFSEF